MLAIDMVSPGTDLVPVIGSNAYLSSISSDGNLVSFTTEERILEEDVNSTRSLYVKDFAAANDNDPATKAYKLVAETQQLDLFSAGFSPNRRFLAYQEPGSSVYDYFFIDGAFWQLHQVTFGRLVIRDLTNGTSWAANLSSSVRLSTITDTGVVALTANNETLTAKWQDARGFWYAIGPGVETVLLASESGGVRVLREGKNPILSSDGHYIAFTSGGNHAFRRKLATITSDEGIDEIVDTNGVSPIVGAASATAISANGRYVTFTSSAPNLVPGDTNDTDDVFRRDFLTTTPDTVKRVSVNQLGVQADRNSLGGTISDDGRFVAFGSAARNLGAVSSLADYNVFVKDLDSDELILLAAGNGTSFGAAISADGKYVAFGSDANNLSPDDHNAGWDVFRALNLLADPPPTVAISGIAPGVHTTAVGLVTFTFSEPVTGFNSSKVLLYNVTGDYPIDVSWLPMVQTGAVTYVMDLSPVTGFAASYQLSVPASADVIDSVGHTLRVSETVSWQYNAAGTYSIQNGDAQRSFIRYVDVTFGSTAGLDAVLLNAASRIKLTKYDLNGNFGTAARIGTVVRVGPILKFDFGANGIGAINAAGVGANRNTDAGDGYYELSIDLDGDGIHESTRRFFRLFGDVNGDATVDQTDVTLLQAALNAAAALGVPPDQNFDMNGDMQASGLRRIDASDLMAVLNAKNRGRKLAAHLIGTLDRAFVRFIPGLPPGNPNQPPRP